MNKKVVEIRLLLLIILCHHSSLPKVSLWLGDKIFVTKISTFPTCSYYFSDLFSERVHTLKETRWYLDVAQICLDALATQLLLCVRPHLCMDSALQQSNVFALRRLYLTPFMYGFRTSTIECLCAPSLVPDLIYVWIPHFNNLMFSLRCLYLTSLSHWFQLSTWIWWIRKSVNLV